MRHFSIYPLYVGDITRQKSNMAYLQEPGVLVDFPLICWYITDGVHKIMVDTGGRAPDGRWQPYRRAPEQDLPFVLSQLGVCPGDITDVILTHLHWDHAGNNHIFTNARFYVQRRELEEAANPPIKLFAGSYDNEAIFQTNYVALDGDCTILDGVQVITTPGHSMGSQSVVIDTAAGIHLITGDLIALYECYEHVPMFVNGIHIDLREYYQSLERVKQIGGAILPGHDYKVLQHSCYPVI